MTRIVTTHYRYKRPPPKRKPAALEVPAIVRTLSSRLEKSPGKGRAGNDNRAEAGDKSPDVGIIPSRIVTARHRKHVMHAHLLEDMTPEEHQRRGDAAQALWRELVRRTAARRRD